MSQKRTNYLNWTDYFIGITKLVSQRSKDPVHQVGAVIVNPTNNTIISTGYNGFPYGCSDDEYPWSNDEKAGWLQTKYPYVVHAEVNAILYARQDCSGFELYSTLFPCNECAKLIIQAGIKKVYFLKTAGIDKGRWEDSFKATTRMFKDAKVEVRELTSIL